MSNQRTAAWHFPKNTQPNGHFEIKVDPKAFVKVDLICSGGTQTNPCSSLVFSNFNVCGSSALKRYEPMCQGYLLQLPVPSLICLLVSWLTIQKLFSDAVFLNSIQLQLSLVGRHFPGPLCVSSGGGLALFIGLVSPALCLVSLAAFKRTGSCHQ